jgi:Family of unknown function (DUF5990)
MADRLEYTVTLQVTCQYPPLQPGDFGLQDKDNRLSPPTSTNADAWTFECAVRVKQNEKTGMPNFLGEFTHGTAEERFLYLSLRSREGASNAWLKRIKVPLKSITWEQVMEAVRHEDVKLACTVEGIKSGMVKLLGVGWQVVI